MNKKYKMVKFFKRCDFPEKVKKAFHNFVTNSHLGYCNGSSVSWNVGSVRLENDEIGNPEKILLAYQECYGEEEGEWMYIVDCYLYENDCIENEQVLIEFSW